MRSAIAFVMLIVATTASFAAEPTAAKSPVRKPYGIENRELWTTSAVVGTPDPPSPYRMERAFRQLQFNEPLELSTVPGSDRWVVAERKGNIFLFDNRPDAADKHLLLDVARTVYGVVLHPQFAANGYFYVANIPDPSKEQPTGSRISRYQAKGNPPTADRATEKVILEWPNGGHNGGCMRFGPDGYLYLSTGDGSGIADALQSGQDISDLLGSILRIDVNKVEGNRPYSIPADNPFVAMKDARPEIYAYGLRQAWKFSFDTTGGDLWAGEVGQDLWEMVLRIEKGGNYGWSVQEGLHPFRPERKKGPTPILPPVLEHPHSDFRSITGGYVYHGKRWPELEGHYVYGDYDMGRIWSFKYAGGKVIQHRELADTQLRIVAWGQDRAGEVYALDFAQGGIHQLTLAPPAVVDAPKFPRLLSETGLFASTKEHRPAAGVIPYSVNSELWSDGASKDRFLAVPGDKQIEFETVTYPQPAPGSSPGWRFPTGTVLVKTFSIDLETGNAASRKRLETRLLHAEFVPGNEEYGDQVWNGYTYVWNDAQTDAELLDAKGQDRKLTIKEAGRTREQVWHFPSRAECTLCHTMSAKYALGVTTAQMNRDHDYGGVVANQLATLSHLGLFTKPLAKPPEEQSKLVDYHDASQPIDLRARAYLQANCSHCHRKWGGGNAEFQLLSTLPLQETGAVNTRAGQGTFGLMDPRILVPGAADRSLLLVRMQKLGLGRMPHVASNVVDTEAIELVRQWIDQLPK